MIQLVPCNVLGGIPVKDIGNYLVLRVSLLVSMSGGRLLGSGLLGALRGGLLGNFLGSLLLSSRMMSRGMMFLGRMLIVMMSDTLMLGVSLGMRGSRCGISKEHTECNENE